MIADILCTTMFFSIRILGHIWEFFEEGSFYISAVDHLM